MPSVSYAFTAEDFARFWPKIDQGGEGGCWQWKASIRPDGYGQLWLPAAGRPIVAHRWAYLALVGPIPEGLELDHLCRNRSCVNPMHLEPVTTRENLLRGVGFSAVNARKMYCSKGHPLFGANLVVRQGKRGCLICRRARGRRFNNRPEARRKNIAYQRARRRRIAAEEGRELAYKGGPRVDVDTLEPVSRVRPTSLSENGE